jgi:hypothetical protein
MFSKLSSVKRFSETKISIHQLVSLIKTNPNKSKIQELRSIDKKIDKKSYDSIKLSLPCIIPSGVFNSISNKGLVKLSGYLYFDIDNFDTKKELNDTIKRLNDTFPITLICKSVGGMGISFLVKINDIESYDFSLLYDYVFNLISEKGFNLDKNAKGIVRKMFISSDEDLIFNFENQFEINRDQIDLMKLRNVKEIKKNQELKRKGETELNDTLEIIPIEELMKQLKFESRYEKQIDGEWIVEDMSYHYIIPTKKIKDGEKHKVYARITNGLYYLNPEITKLQVISYLYWLNKNQNEPMSEKELVRYVSSICQSIESTGEIYIKTRTKRIHFNKESSLTKKEKQKIAQNIMASRKVNESIKRIIEAKEFYFKQNVVATQKMIAEHTGLGIATVKRHWMKEIMEIEKSSPRIEMVKELPVIEEEEFYNQKPIEKKKIKIKHRGWKEVEIDEVTKEDVSLFLKEIKRLDTEWFGVSEELLIYSKIFDEYKTVYMYNKYILKKNLN